MKLMKTTEAVGQVLCHDITQIIPGVKKDAVFRKGHIITKEDIPVLLSVGKDTIYIWENDETMMAESVGRQLQGFNAYCSSYTQTKIGRYIRYDFRHEWSDGCGRRCICSQ